MHELYADWIFGPSLAGAHRASAATPLQAIGGGRCCSIAALSDTVPAMARRKRDQGPQLDRPGLPPLLTGHLKPGGVRANESAGAPATEAPSSNTPDEQAPRRSAQPAEDVATSPNQADAITGKATKSPADVATRPHLEGSEQGPA